MNDSEHYQKTSEDRWYIDKASESRPLELAIPGMNGLRHGAPGKKGDRQGRGVRGVYRRATEDLEPIERKGERRYKSPQLYTAH